MGDKFDSFDQQAETAADIPSLLNCLSEHLAGVRCVYYAVTPLGLRQLEAAEPINPNPQQVWSLTYGKAHQTTSSLMLPLGSPQPFALLEIHNDDAALPEGAAHLVRVAALRIENLHLQEQLAYRRDEMLGLSALAETIMEIADPAAVVQRAARQVGSLVSLDYLAIYLWQEEQKVLTLALQLTSESFILPTQQVIQPETHPLAYDIWDQQEPRLVALDTHPKMNPPGSTGLREMLAVPLTTRSRRLGVMEIGSDTPGNYDSEARFLTRLVGVQLALALASAQRTSASIRLANARSRAAEIAGHLQQASSVEDLFETTLAELGQTLGARRARIRLNNTPPTAEE